MIIRLREKMKRTSKELEEKAEDYKDRCRESEERVKELERDIGKQRQYNDENSGERSHLVSTVQDKDRKLCECRESLRKLQNNYDDVKVGLKRLNNLNTTFCSRIISNLSNL